MCLKDHILQFCFSIFCFQFNALCVNAIKFERTRCVTHHPCRFWSDKTYLLACRAFRGPLSGLSQKQLRCSTIMQFTLIQNHFCTDLPVKACQTIHAKSLTSWLFLVHSVDVSLESTRYFSLQCRIVIYEIIFPV